MKKCFFLSLIIILLNSFTIRAADIWIVVDNLSLQSIEKNQTPAFDRLQKKGAFSLVNVRTADSQKAESTYLSIGSGDRAYSNQYANIAVNTPEGIVNPGVNELIKLNKKNNYNPEIGLLGKKLRENKKKTYVFGNSDITEKQKRTIVSMVMDENGVIPAGDISRKILKTKNKLWGFNTDWLKMKNAVKKNINKADIIFIETGDLTRINYYKNQLNKFQLDQNIERVISNIDDFVGFLLEIVDLNESHLGIIVPTPSSRGSILGGQRLSWILIAGPEIKQGWLTSINTRRQGIITLSNITPAIVNFQGIKTTRPGIKTIQKEVDWQNIIKKNKKIEVISYYRPDFMRGFIGLQLIVIIMAILNLFIDKNIFRGIFSLLTEYLLIVLFLVPVNFLVISIFQFNNPFFYLYLLIILTILEIMFFYKLKLDRFQQIVYISLMTVIVIILDMTFNNYLMADSLLGYSSIIGARYYGMGNEYMGIFIGAGLVGITGVIELNIKNINLQNIKKYIFIPFLILAYIIGAANMGANFGGTLTMIFAIIILFIYLNRCQVNIKTIIWGIIALIIAGIIIFMIHYWQISGLETHITEMARIIRTGDFERIFQVVYRKILMNIKLMRWTVWTKILLGFLIYLLINFIHPVGKIEKIISNYKYLSSGLYAGIAASFMAMIINDSGVVAAATLLFFPVLTLLYLIQVVD